jgi:hypothetical protein
VTTRISNEDVERLLSGAQTIDESQRLADVSSVLHALRTPAEPDELTGLDSALAAFSPAVVTTPFDLRTARTRPMKKKLLTGKVLAAVGAITLASAGAAAAAGVVPSPFSAPRPSITESTERTDDEATNHNATEDTAADTTLGTTATTEETERTDATEPIDQAAAPAVAAAIPTESTDGQGPDVNGPAKFGLCTAFAARTKHDDTTTTTQAGATATAEPQLPVPFQALQDAADAAGQSVADFCVDATPGGASDAPGQSGDNPSATAQGKSADNPSATAPGKSGGTHGNSGADHGHPKARS